MYWRILSTETSSAFGVTVLGQMELLELIGRGQERGCDKEVAGHESRGLLFLVLVLIYYCLRGDLRQ